MERYVIKTSDGSSTIRIEEMDETYHSIHGALNEAIHVFISNGLDHVDKAHIRVFEMGFGTGFNALLAYSFAERSKRKVSYHSIEAFPIEEKLVKELNYVELLGEEYNKPFLAMHAARWNEVEAVSDFFLLKKIHSKIEFFELERGAYDIIFYDAFGPRVQGYLWTTEVLKKMYDGLSENGVLVTYCAQGQFKRNLKNVGFKVESLPGPPGKREMTRAYK